MATGLVVTNEGAELEVQSPQQMAATLAHMKEKLGLVQTFFKEVMVPKVDYGIIPGTEKPTLLKPGAEKLCEFYGYAPKVSHIEEHSDVATGYYRARVTVALVHRRTGIVVAEGVGEANTRENRYRWRWMPEWKLPKGIDTSNLTFEVKKDKRGQTYKSYRLENDDPWTLWNTVLKMAKKRALVDATLSATRSSGIFTQDMEDLQAWAEGGAPVDETEDMNGETPPPSESTKARGSKQAKQPESANGDGAITPAQRDAILKLASQLVPGDDDARAQWVFEQYGVDLATASKADAGDVIQKLQRAIKHGKGGNAQPQAQPAMM